VRVGISLNVETALGSACTDYLPENGKAPQNLSLYLNPDPNFESELARRRPLYCLHDAGRILYDATSFFSSLDERKVITQIVGEIQTIERKLDWFGR